MAPTFLQPSNKWPAGHDEASSARLIERLQSLGDGTEALLAAPGVLPLLHCLGGNSPYLSDLVLREFDVFRHVITNGPDAALEQSLAKLYIVPPTVGRQDLAAILRQAKREIALITAIADVGGIWPLETVTGALSELAEMALKLALRHLLRTAHDNSKIRLSDADCPEHACAFVVLAMGKLGALELNYSSDIDLILLYDASAPVYASHSAADNIGSFTSRLARDIVGLLEARDANGYVFRTDLRLRPDPAATPPAISVLAALTYYESMGQNWERAALIKARPVAGDLALGRRFLEAIRPFIWRRGLDFAAIADIHAMKRRIDTVQNFALGAGSDPVARIAGHNVKLGQGGIREIEFLVQTLQMVWGGRDPTLRIRPTLQAAARLMETGHLSPDARRQLEHAYRFLRQVEHRIQMVNDRQTHNLPEQPAEMARIAKFMGYNTASAFAASFLHHVEIVRANYRMVFEYVPEGPGSGASGPVLDFSGDEPEPAATVASLHALGFNDHRRVIAGVRGWLAGHVRALRSTRARDLMTFMVPVILTALGRQDHPNEAFNRFDRFISVLPAGVQPMSLFHRNPALLERIAAVLGAAPILSEHLARYPGALEGLLTGTVEIDLHRMLRAHLSDSTRLEEVIQTVRRSVKEHDFLLSVATLEGRLDANTAGRRRTALAQAALMILVPKVLNDYADRFGRVPGGGLAVVALGKAGGREMMAGSDLDLMFIYDHPREISESQGARIVPAGQWFVRAVQACIAALTAPGPEGPMYEIDMRLRPSGKKGPIAVSLAGFQRYHAEDAQTWERMALTRARVVAGPPSLRKQVNQAIQKALMLPRNADGIRADAAAMRTRMTKELHPHGSWDFKLRVGGLIDVEFITQVLQLIHVGLPGFSGSQTTRITLQRLREAGLISPEDARLLIDAERLWRTIQGMLRITVGRTEADELPASSSTPLLKAAAKAGVAAVDSAELLHKSDLIAQQVCSLFEYYVGKTG